ncbi:flavodoxin family protein [Clostridium saccharoperbutylacetonicum]|uniref:flavodoxin family protein n=1 Tax=Clostridium saccharoperbutylacetonicum TaxID=36745 RepID=UPI000983B0B6|nr:flavodoxin family protein [Clostridium saccharoperbutylacetonicum]AQR96632.1 iron-sulfur flavoprotein [Clostridium saccharoperbutylacetonicum]NSB32508.1 multimeric flavodoxin WrbA [Clostridium saccharoperbutylacetonicum]
MKITVLMGSPRKKDSYNVCELIKEILQKKNDINFEYIFLKDYRIEDCKGCDMCFKRSEKFCPCEDDLNKIKEKLLNSDGIILATPVYAYQVPAPLKRVFDRLSYLFHRQELVGKPILTVVTTGGGGHNQVTKYLKMTVCGWGGNLIGSINIISPMFFENLKEDLEWVYDRRYYKKSVEKIERDVKSYVEIIGSKNLHNPTLYDIFMFNCLRSKTFTSQADYDFWKKRGWLDSYYFYDIQLNFLKKGFGCILKNLINLAGRRLKNKSIR